MLGEDGPSRAWGDPALRPHDHERAAGVLGAAVRRNLRAHHLDQRSAAAVQLQHAARGWASRQRSDWALQLVERDEATARMQAAMHGYRARRRVAYLRNERAAILVQAAVRGRQSAVAAVAAIEREAAALLMQAAVHGCRSRRRVAQLQKERSTVRLQAASRGAALRRALRAEDCAATFMVRAWRRRCGRVAWGRVLAAGRERARLRDAATCCARAWRRRCGRVAWGRVLAAGRERARLRDAATCCARAWRRRCGRVAWGRVLAAGRSNAKQRRHHAASRMQAAYRGLFARLLLSALRDAIRAEDCAATFMVRAWRRRCVAATGSAGVRRSTRRC